ncbi:MAG: OmpA family protein, partial [Sinomicrobium sp.]|nr:OmpA family protein [Sinomicrobium sp.]
VIYFDFDSEQYSTDGELKEYIKALKTYLEAGPARKISIIGHTDNVGETADNEWIGMQRAKSAMKYLVSQGIPEERITLYSKGESEPIAPNTTGEGRKRNRRVEININ